MNLYLRERRFDIVNLKTGIFHFLHSIYRFLAERSASRAKQEIPNLGEPNLKVAWPVSLVVTTTEE